MNGNRNRTIQGLIMLDQPQQDECSPDGGLNQDADDGKNRELSHGMTSWKPSEAKEPEDKHQEQTEARTGPVRELDQGLLPCQDGEHLPIAERPVLTAAGTRTRGAYQGAPEDDHHDKNQCGDAEPHKTRIQVSFICHAPAIRYE